MLKHIPFYASLLGRTVGTNSKATHAHVLVYGAIDAHSFGNAGCIASNTLLAQETGLALKTVKNVLSQIATVGWIVIEYKDAHKQSRGVITPMLTIAVPSLPRDTPVPTTGHPRPYHGTIGNSVGNSVETTCDATASRVLSDGLASIEKHNKLGAEIIKAFEPVNLIAKRMYGNTTQRKACDDLLDIHPLDRILAVVNVLGQTNNMPYMPTITTPLQLLSKWTQLESAMHKHQMKLKETDEKYKVAFT